MRDAKDDQKRKAQRLQNVCPYGPPKALQAFAKALANIRSVN